MYKFTQGVKNVLERLIKYAYYISIQIRVKAHAFVLFIVVNKE